MKSNRVGLAVEVLEDRCLPAGTVTLEFDDLTQTLFVTGDDFDNQVTLSLTSIDQYPPPPVPGSYRVVPYVTAPQRETFLPSDFGRLFFVFGRQGTATAISGATAVSLRLINTASAVALIQEASLATDVVRRIVVNLAGGNDDLIINYWDTQQDQSRYPLGRNLPQWDGTVSIQLGAGSDRLRIEPRADGTADFPRIEEGVVGFLGTFVLRASRTPFVSFGPDDTANGLPGFSLDVSSGTTESVQIRNSEFRGTVRARMGATSNQRTWLLSNVSVTAGDVDIRVYQPSRTAETVTFDNVVVSGSVYLFLGAGKKTVQFVNNNTTVGAGVEVNLRPLAGSAEATADDDEVFIDQDLRSPGDSEAPSLGPTTITGGPIATKVTVTRSKVAGIKFTGGNGGTTLTPDILEISDSNINGNILFSAAAADDVFRMYRVDVSGDVSFFGGLGNDQVTVTTGMNITGGFVASMGPSRLTSGQQDDDSIVLDDVSALEADIRLGAGANTLLAFRTRLNGPLNVVGGIGSDYVALLIQISIVGPARIDMGAGDDVLLLSGGRMASTVSIFGGDGDDFVRITNWSFTLPTVTLDGGAGRDELVLGGLNRRPRPSNFETVG
jgi:hypothetical protein